MGTAGTATIDTVADEYLESYGMQPRPNEGLH